MTVNRLTLEPIPRQAIRFLFSWICYTWSGQSPGFAGRGRLNCGARLYFRAPAPGKGSDFMLRWIFILNLVKDDPQEGITTMPRRYMGHIGGLALFLFVAASVAVAAPGYLRITVNDAFTHYAVPAFVKGAGPELFSVYTDEAGRLNRELAPGEYRIEVSAPRYKDLKSRATMEAGKTNFLGFMLTPLDPPEEEKLVPSRLRPGFTLIQGYAIDDRGQPVGGVRVHLEKAGTATVTDRRGYYWMSAPTPPEAAPDVPGIDTLIAEKRGYRTIVHRNIPIGGDDAGGYFLEMERGTGKREFDDTHKQMRKNVEPQAKPPYAPKKRARDRYDWLEASPIPEGVACELAAAQPQA